MDEIEVCGEVIVELSKGKYLINVPKSITIKAYLTPQKVLKEKVE